MSPNKCLCLSQSHSNTLGTNAQSHSLISLFLVLFPSSSFPLSLPSFSSSQSLPFFSLHWSFLFFFSLLNLLPIRVSSFLTYIVILVPFLIIICIGHKGKSSKLIHHWNICVDNGWFSPLRIFFMGLASFPFGSPTKIYRYSAITSASRSYSAGSSTVRSKTQDATDEV